jgi:hypothetical protein
VDVLLELSEHQITAVLAEIETSVGRRGQRPVGRRVAGQRGRQGQLPVAVRIPEQELARCHHVVGSFREPGDARVRDAVTEPEVLATLQLIGGARVQHVQRAEAVFFADLGVHRVVEHPLLVVVAEQRQHSVQRLALAPPLPIRGCALAVVAEAPRAIGVREALLERRMEAGERRRVEAEPPEARVGEGDVETEGPKVPVRLPVS